MYPARANFAGSAERELPMKEIVFTLLLIVIGAIGFYLVGREPKPKLRKP